MWFRSGYSAAAFPQVLNQRLEMSVEPNVDNVVGVQTIGCAVAGDFDARIGYGLDDGCPWNSSEAPLWRFECCPDTGHPTV